MKNQFLSSCCVAAALQFIMMLPCAAQAIHVGRSLPLTGPLKAIGEFKRDGGDAYIKKVNESGGVGGKTIELVTLDDAYVADNTITNLRKISSERAPVAFLNSLRLPAVGNALPILNELKIPFVGVSSATDALRAQFNPYGFPVRAGSLDEIAKLANHAKVIGINKISVIYQDVPLGHTLLAQSETSFKAANLNLSSFKLDAVASNIAEVARQALQAQPQAIFLGVLTPAAVALISELRKISFNGPIYGSSSADALVIAKLLGKQAVGLAFSQIVPLHSGLQVKVVAEYQQAMKNLGRGVPSGLGLEAFIEAKVLVEGLKRAGPNPTPAALARGLETLRDMDLGGFFVSYTPEVHTGSLFVEIDVINAKGELMR